MLAGGEDYIQDNVMANAARMFISIVVILFMVGLVGVILYFLLRYLWEKAKQARREQQKNEMQQASEVSSIRGDARAFSPSLSLPPPSLCLSPITLSDYSLYERY